MNSQSKSLSFWAEKYEEIEASIVSGKHPDCRNLLDLVRPQTLPREWAPRYADLANRIHHCIYALKALHRFIAPENSLDAGATDNEKIIYAYALCILGATDEALEILNSVNTQALPEGLFLKALTLFRKWNYAQSIPLLKDFLNASNVEPYRRLVGEVNLVAAHVFIGDWDQALKGLEKVQGECQQGQYDLLLGNSYELKAQVFFFQNQYEKALKCLEQARIFLQGQQGLYLLFVEKWSIICHLFKKDVSGCLEQLRDLRLKAQGLDDFETVRECELFEAIATENENLLRKVIMGTPSEFYRQRARQLFGKALKPLGQFAWDLNLQAQGDPATFDPYEKQNGTEALYEKPHLLAVFEALTIDFYRPCHLGGLFKSVYPDEKFNPYNSPARVMQLLKRLDHWFEEQKLPLRVEFKKSQFRLISLRPIRVLVQSGRRMSSVEGRWSEIKNKFEGRTFTTAKISEAMGVSKTSAQRILKQALAEGRVQSVGRGRGTIYQFSTRKKARLAA